MDRANTHGANNSASQNSPTSDPQAQPVSTARRVRAFIKSRRARVKGFGLLLFYCHMLMVFAFMGKLYLPDLSELAKAAGVIQAWQTDAVREAAALVQKAQDAREALGDLTGMEGALRLPEELKDLRKSAGELSDSVRNSRAVEWVSARLPGSDLADGDLTDGKLPEQPEQSGQPTQPDHTDQPSQTEQPSAAKSGEQGNPQDCEATQITGTAADAGQTVPEPAQPDSAQTGFLRANAGSAQPDSAPSDSGHHDSGLAGSGQINAAQNGSMQANATPVAAADGQQATAKKRIFAQEITLPDLTALSGLPLAVKISSALVPILFGITTLSLLVTAFFRVGVVLGMGHALLCGWLLAKAAFSLNGAPELFIFCLGEKLQNFANGGYAIWLGALAALLILLGLTAWMGRSRTAQQA